MNPTSLLTSSLRQALAFSASVFILSLSAHAAGVTHTLTSGGGDGSWATAGNWTNGVPDAAGDIAAYSTASVSAPFTLDKIGGEAVTIGIIAKTASGSWTINAGTASGFIMDNTGGTGNAVIRNTSGSGTLTINSNVMIANAGLDINTTSAITIGGNIAANTNTTLTIATTGSGVATTINGSIGATGAGTIAIINAGGRSANTAPSTSITGNIGAQVSSITQNSGGTLPSALVLSGDNSAFIGDVTIMAGTLRASSANALSASNLVAMEGGTFDFNESVTVQGLQGATGNVYSSGGGSRTLTLGGAGANTYGGTIATASQTVTQRSRTALRVALTGSGVQTLTGESVYGGGTTIESGTLLVNNTTGSGTGTGAVAVDGGTLGGTGFIDGATAVTGGNLAAGTDGTVGTLTFSSTLDVAGLTGNGQLKFDLGGVGASDQIIANTFSFGTGVLNFDDFDFTTVSGFVGGTFTLVDATSISGTLGSSLNGTIDGLAAELSLSGNGLILTVAAIPEPSTYAALAGALALSGAALRRRRQ